MRLNRKEEEMEEIVRKFTPLVRSVARRYEGRGAEFEDLLQEGYLALLKLAPRCSDERLPLYLKNRLPGMVRDAARRLRKPPSTEMDRLEGTRREPRTEPARSMLAFCLERILPREDRLLVSMIVRGHSQREAASVLGISQQAVSARLARIRKRASRNLADEFLTA